MTTTNAPRDTGPAAEAGDDRRLRKKKKREDGPTERDPKETKIEMERRLNR